MNVDFTAMGQLFVTEWRMCFRTSGTVLILHNDTLLNKSNSLNIPGFPGRAVVKNPPANAGDTGSIPGLGRSHMPRSN